LLAIKTPKKEHKLRMHPHFILTFCVQVGRFGKAASSFFILTFSGSVGRNRPLLPDGILTHEDSILAAVDDVDRTMQYPERDRLTVGSEFRFPNTGPPFSKINTIAAHPFGGSDN
jgi:hypothetical protein